jgi:uncharacterized membrane protein YvbJ
MSYCPKCGANVAEEMEFCPKCGAPLKVAQAPVETRARAYRRDEKAEKAEKREKTEKYEKREYGFMGPLIGGLILIFLGLAFYLRIALNVSSGAVWAIFFVIIGIVIIAAAVYGAMTAGKRHPRA